MNSIENNFVSYQIALDMKSIGFDEPCLGLYKFKNLTLEYPYLTNTGLINSNLEKYCSAPLYQQAFRWFREKYGLHYRILFGTEKYAYSIIDNKGQVYVVRLSLNIEYEEAELECLVKLIEICRELK